MLCIHIQLIDSFAYIYIYIYIYTYIHIYIYVCVCVVVWVCVCDFYPLSLQRIYSECKYIMNDIVYENKFEIQKQVMPCYILLKKNLCIISKCHLKTISTPFFSDAVHLSSCLAYMITEHKCIFILSNAYIRGVHFIYYILCCFQT